jgi:preprotein translocase subunit SecG
MLTFFQIIQIISAILTVTLILVHTAKGEGIGSIGSASQMFSSSSQLEKGLNILTWSAGLFFLISSASLSWGFIK